MCSSSKELTPFLFDHLSSVLHGVNYISKWKLKQACGKQESVFWVKNLVKIFNAIKSVSVIICPVFVSCRFSRRPEYLTNGTAIFHEPNKWHILWFLRSLDPSISRQFGASVKYHWANKSYQKHPMRLKIKRNASIADCRFLFFRSFKIFGWPS